jgi:hypothetical protein
LFGFDKLLDCLPVEDVEMEIGFGRVEGGANR